MPLTLPEQAINERIIIRGLHIRANRILVLMLTANIAKSKAYDDEIERLTNFPDSLLWELKQTGIIGQTALDIVAEKLQFYTDKKARILDKQFLLQQEQTFRRDGKVVRNPRE